MVSKDHDLLDSISVNGSAITVSNWLDGLSNQTQPPTVAQCSVHAAALQWGYQTGEQTFIWPCRRDKNLSGKMHQHFQSQL